MKRPMETPAACPRRDVSLGVEGLFLRAGWTWGATIGAVLLGHLDREALTVALGRRVQEADLISKSRTPRRLGCDRLAHGDRPAGPEAGAGAARPR